MLLLAIETATAQSSVALVDNTHVVASASLGVARRHGEFVTPAIDFCLQQAGMTIDRVTGVAVGLGPGLFTGLRVGIATAQVIAATRSLPAVGLSSLDVLAFPVRHARRLTCAVIDARRGELSWAFYRGVPGGVQRDGEIQLGGIDRLVAEIRAQSEGVLVVGDGAINHRDALDDADAIVAGPETAWPSAAVLGALAAPRFEREETQPPTALQPLYLRQADAKIGWQTRGRLRGGAA
ncbi:MAG: tRNA (adenosine(37)-N6)-threonylcarbamoyltransferase complex dimerization subunit type 1 TsaB [Nitriliruptoraceae bacterium]